MIAPAGPRALEEAHKHCAALAREHAHDEWLGSLYAGPREREALLTLAAFDFEIRRARFRARDANLAGLRLSWWRGVVAGERDEEAAGSPVALALRAAMEDFALPSALLEAMLDGQLTELMPDAPFNLAEFQRFAEESEGARLRLATRIAAGGRDLYDANASGAAGMAFAVRRLIATLPSKAGRAPILFPADVAERHGARIADFEARHATGGILAACAEMLALARDSLAEADRRLNACPQDILPAFAPLGALSLDFDRLEQNAARPFEPAREISPIRRQWTIWRWARRR